MNLFLSRSFVVKQPIARVARRRGVRPIRPTANGDRAIRAGDHLNGQAAHVERGEGRVLIGGLLRLVIRPGRAALPSPGATRSAQGRGSSSPLPERWRRPDDYFQSVGSARGSPERRGRIAPARKRARGPGRGKRQGAPWSGGLAMHHHTHPGSDPSTPSPGATESGARRCRRFGRCRRQWRYRATSTAGATRLRKGRRSCQREECGLFSYA